MNLDQLRAIRAIADLGGFEKAADALCVSQPALSAQIKLLESEAGDALFLKAGRKKVLTASGCLVLSHARIILAEIERLQNDLAALRGLGAGSLSIATGDTVACRLLAPLLVDFSRLYPGISLHLLNRTSDETATLVREGRADIGIATLPINLKGLSVEEWRDYGWVGIEARGDRTGEVPVSIATPEKIEGESLLLLEAGTRARLAVDAAFAAAGRRPSRVMELGGVESQIEFAIAGLGLAIIPDFAFSEIAGESESKLSIVALPWIPRCTLGTIIRAEGNSTAATAFLGMMREARYGEERRP